MNALESVLSVHLFVVIKALTLNGNNNTRDQPAQTVELGLMAKMRYDAPSSNEIAWRE